MTSMTKIWTMYFAILSALLMSSAIVLPTTFAATQASPPVLQNPLLAGYAAVSTNGSVTGVFVSFTIPQVTCDPTAATSQGLALVASMDGYNSADFEYVGVESFCQLGPNSPIYFAFSSGIYNSILGIVPVKAGDVISAGITVSGGNFHYTFKDVTTGKSATDSSPATNVALNAAECGVLGFIPLSKFAPASFGKEFTNVPNTCDAKINGAKHSIGKFGSTVSLYELVLINQATTDTLATPSALSGGGSSFSVTWNNAS